MGNHIVFVDAPRESVRPVLEVLASKPHNHAVCYDVDDTPENWKQALGRLMNKYNEIKLLLDTHKGPWPVFVATSLDCLAARFDIQFETTLFNDMARVLMKTLPEIEVGYVRVSTEDENDQKIFDLLHGPTISMDDDDATLLDVCVVKSEAQHFATTLPKIE